MKSTTCVQEVSNLSLQVGAVRTGKGLGIRTRVEPAGMGEHRMGRHGQTRYKLRVNMRHNGGMCLELTNSPALNPLFESTPRSGFVQPGSVHG
jgi:hypothetical protein